MPFTIEMTLRGVLLAGKWRRADELNHMPTVEKRNALVVELSKRTNQTVKYFSGFDDDTLVGKGATVVFLREAGIRDDNALKNMSDGDERNAMVVEINNRTDRGIPQLSAMSDRELVQVGLEWFANSRTVAAILEFDWKIDQAKVLTNVPDIIATENYDNSKSSQPLNSTFIVNKEVSNTSTFSEEHGFEFGTGAATEFKAGIPSIAENTTTVTVDTSTTHNWQLGGENSTTQSYTHQSDVVVPAFKHIQKIASVTKGNLDVPYRAKIRTGDGSIQWIEGTWKGVSTVNLVEKQVDIDP
jgi:Clostridium epsilon toxin ETX/Bacillus mosquitocidal toxin MTX2